MKKTELEIAGENLAKAAQKTIIALQECCKAFDSLSKTKTIKKK